jgi:hypothetical protein
MTEVWVLILGLAWGNPESRTTQVGDVLKIERVQVATREQCERGAAAWMDPNRTAASSGYTRAFATCAGRKAGE